MFTFIVLLTFASLVLGVMSMYWLFSKPANTVAARLDVVDPSLALLENNPITTMTTMAAEPINKIIPISAVEAAKLQKQLMHAGYSSPDAAMAYRAIQLLSFFAFPSVVVTTFFLLDRSLNSLLIWGMLAAALGFYLPRIILRRMITGRQRRITWALADALDLMVIAVEAGLGLNAALNRVGEELKDLHPEMHRELELVNLEIRVGRGREEALRNLTERTGVDDIRSFVALLIQADRFGSSIAKAVRVFADSLRTKRRQRAEQASAKAALKLLIPLTAFLFPVIVSMILAPAALNLLDLFSK
jgi:tight adherence protein C